MPEVEDISGKSYFCRKQLLLSLYGLSQHRILFSYITRQNFDKLVTLTHKCHVRRLHYQQSYLYSVPHSFTPGSRLNYSTNPFNCWHLTHCTFLWISYSHRFCFSLVL